MHVTLSRLCIIGCLHDPANVQHYICWQFAGRLLDRVDTPLHSNPCRELSQKVGYFHYFKHGYECSAVVRDRIQTGIQILNEQLQIYTAALEYVENDAS